LDLSVKALCGAAAALAALLAVVAGLADYRERKRRDLDRIGLVDWRSVQLFAILTGVVLAGLAINL